jgi:hypothetical protein
MDPALRRYLTELTERARGLLGADLVGVYAAGSVGLGAYQPGRSDVDVALVSAGPLTGATKRALVAALRHESLPCPARGLELVGYRREVALSGTPDPGFEFELNSGAGMPFRVSWQVADRPAADGLFWYALDRSILHQQGYRLAGPPAAEVFGAVPPAELRTLLVAALTWWSQRPGPVGPEPTPGAEETVLGACRSLVRVRHGVWTTKVEAGRRLIAAGDPAAGLIERCVTARHGGPPPGAAEARAFGRRVLAEVAAVL